MSSSAKVHVVSKTDNTKHAVAPIERSSLPQLAVYHIRVRAALISLTANNLSYARAGATLKWWDAYPVPSELPPPYNNREQYGIIPAWGYGEIIETKITGLEVGMLVWGFWPTSDLPVDLRLISGETEGHFIETTPYRQTMMNLYNRYAVRDPSMRLSMLDDEAIEKMSWEAVFRPVWGAGFLLNRYILGEPHIHPLGAANGGVWTSADADLSNALVISLSASGKTARGFTDELVNNREPHTGPLALLAISSVTEGLLPSASFPTKTASYSDVDSSKTLDWIVRQKTGRIVIVDFGGRGNSLEQLVKAHASHFSRQKLTIVGIGGEAKVYSAQEWRYFMDRNASLKARVQINTSGVRDTAMDIFGPSKFFESYDNAWKAFIDRGNTNKMKLVLGRGVEGEGGLEGGYQKLLNQAVPPNVGLAYVL